MNGSKSGVVRKRDIFNTSIDDIFELHDPDKVRKGRGGVHVDVADNKMSVRVHYQYSI